MNLFEKIDINKLIPLFEANKGHFVVNEAVGLPLVLTKYYFEKKKPFLIITSNLYNAQKLTSFLSSFIKDKEVLLFPDEELIRSEMLAESKEFLAQRLYSLNKIINKEAAFVICNMSGFSRYLPEKDLFASFCLKLKLHQEINVSFLKKSLIQCGYALVNKVDQSLQFAIRGDIIDVFSINSDYPLRIELDFDEISSLRYFDIASQSSIEEIDSIEILPASDILFTNEETAQIQYKINEILAKNKLDLPNDLYETLLSTTQIDIDNILNKNFSPKSYKYYGFLKEHKSTIIDYCQNYNILFVDFDSVYNSYNLLIEESSNYLYELHEAGKIISHLNLYKNYLDLFKNHIDNYLCADELIRNANDVVIDIKEVSLKANKFEDCFNIISHYLNGGYKILISVTSESELKILEEVLLANQISYKQTNDLNIIEDVKVSILLYILPSGFVLENEKIVCLTSKELFKSPKKITRFTNKFKEGTILKSFEDLNPGDYVVHEYQGVGQFESLVTLETEGTHKDFLKILYSGDEILYVPLTQFQLVRKYLGKEGYKPRLSRLHSKDWENEKKRIKERINELANRLMNLYIERSKVVGFAFEKDDELQKEFEDSFDYELTKDQQKSLDEIKADMEKNAPMDRLLCGDVGFGKTEVAFRAAFKAILSHKQVALLCPTTLLARQHFERALARFKPYGVRVALLSRMVSDKEIQATFQGINDGSVDFVIATHKLFNKNIVFKDLGLLIVDEEQRFGVEQKEKIKEIKNNIDVLTLSATPIPRTLQISLLGVRSLSQINTPPVDRMPIQTYVLPYNERVVKELIERELGRHGQVYYLHNDVESLYRCASNLSRLIPAANIGVGHGQMDKKELEDVMEKFYKGDIDVLVCTTIIENGIDVPNANMIIVEEADKYGLSQLYQIKGRVGRSDRIAYAYLMYNEYKKLNDSAKKRLKALQEFTDLGSGYKIAQRDLLIRGAGDILGPEQAGFIDSIGLDMYIKLLNEAVKEKINGKEAQENDSNIKPNPNLTIDAFIPDDYAKESDKIELYQEIASTKTIEELVKLKASTRDIYGKMPNSVSELFKKQAINIYTSSGAIDSVKEMNKNIEIILSSDFLKIRAVGNLLFEAFIPYLSFCKVSYINHLFKINMSKRNNWSDDLIDILKSINNVYNTNKE